MPGSPHTIGPVATSTALAVAVDALAVALHVELLQVGRQPAQLLVVGQHGVGVGAEEVGVPHADQPERHRQVVLERRRPKVLVDLVGAVEQLRRSWSEPMAMAIGSPIDDHSE